MPPDPDPKVLLDQLPHRHARSKLEPYSVLIRGLRQKRYTYQEIADTLGQHYNLRVDPSTVFDFCKRHRKEPQPQLPPVPTEQQQSPSIPKVPKKRFHYDPDEGLTLPDEALNLKPKKD